MDAYGREAVMEYHKGGKVGVRLPRPLKTKDEDGAGIEAVDVEGPAQP